MQYTVKETCEIHRTHFRSPGSINCRYTRGGGLNREYRTRRKNFLCKRLCFLSENVRWGKNNFYQEITEILGKNKKEEKIASHCLSSSIFKFLSYPSKSFWATWKSSIKFIICFLTLFFVFEFKYRSEKSFISTIRNYNYL